MIKNRLQSAVSFLRRFLDRQGDLLGILIAFAGAFAVYRYTLAPSVATVFDDSLEMQLVAFRLGIAHPTGYPLYTLLGKLFTLLPLNDVAFRVNLMSAFFGALTVALVFLLGRRLGNGHLPALAAALILAFSPAFWSQAVVAEVYTLNAFFVAAMLLLVLSATSGQRQTGGDGGPPATSKTPFYLLAFWYGLSLTHHRTMLLLAPALALYLWLQRKSFTPSHSLIRSSLYALALFALPLLLYLYIPIRGMVATSLDGTYQNTLPGFLAWVTGSSYGVFLGDNPLQAQPRTLDFAISLFVEQFSILGIGLGLAGFLWLWRKAGREFALVGLAFATYVAFVLVYRVPDVEVFYLPAYLFFALVIGSGLTGLWQWSRGVGEQGSAGAGEQGSTPAPRRRRALAALVAGARWLVAASCLLAVLLLPAYLLRENLPRQDMSQNWTTHEYGQEILRQPMENGSAVVGILGEMTLLRYFQETEGSRPDLVTIAADREEDRLKTIRQALQSGKPVYLTRPLKGVEQAYPLTSFGPLIKVLPAPLTEPPTIPWPRVLDFSGEITLLGYALDEAPGVQPSARGSSGLPGGRAGRDSEGVEAGKRLGVTLYWRAAKKLAQDYKVSLRLVSAAGRLIAQQDSMPIYDAYPTSAWRQGEVVVDTHYLHVPLGTSPGEYRLQMSLYSEAMPNGVKSFDGSKLETVVDLGPVSVARPLKPPSLDALPARIPKPAGRPSLPGWTESESLATLGVSTVVGGNFDNQFTLFGYGLSRETLKPGEGADVILLWQAEREIDSDYVVFVQLVDQGGKIWASSDSMPVDGDYPTSRWTRGEIVGDRHTLILPANAPNGEYQLQVGLYRQSDKERLTVLRWTRRSSDTLDLGAVTVKGRDRQFSPPPIANRQQARIGSQIQFLGYDLEVSKSAAQPQAGVYTLKLTLYWKALAALDRSYTVFTHLLDKESRIWAQQDGLPQGGAAPTTSWLAGEVLADEYVLPVKPNASPGDYVVEIGFYDGNTGQRLLVFDDQGMPQGDRILLERKITLE